MNTINIHVEVGFTEQAASILRGLLGNGQQPTAAPAPAAAPAKETKPSPAQVVMETKIEEPIEAAPAQAAAPSGDIDDKTLREHVRAAVNATTREAVKALLSEYEWYTNAAIQCPAAERPALVERLKTMSHAK